MELSLLLIIIGTVLAILINYALGNRMHPDRPRAADLAAGLGRMARPSHLTSAQASDREEPTGR
jgi:hypothetical protein